MIDERTDKPGTTLFRRFLTPARFVRSAGHDCLGSMVVEFALLFPVILVIFFAIIQWGFIMYSRQDMLHAAREAARSYAIGLYDAEEAGRFAAELLQPNLPEDTESKYTIRVITEEGSVGGGSGSGGGASVSGDVTVIITIPLADAALVSFLEKTVLTGDIEVSATMLVQATDEDCETVSKPIGYVNFLVTKLRLRNAPS